MKKAVAVAAFLALAGNVALGVVVYNQYTVIEDLQASRRVQGAMLGALNGETESLQVVLRDVQTTVLELEPFDPSKLDRQINELRSRMNSLGSDVRFLLTYAAPAQETVSIDPRDIDLPPFCLQGDVAIWDFRGLTC